MKSDNFWGQMGWGNLLGGIGWGAIWVGIGFMLLGMGGCGYLVFHGDKAGTGLVNIHVHLK
jgi:hypothetical protein